MSSIVCKGVIAAVTAALLISCTTPTATSPVPATSGALGPTVDQGYPVPSLEGTLEGYPSQMTEPAPALLAGEVAFRLTKPVLAGATEVNGSGTPEVPIILYNVTFMGEVMGETSIGADGLFRFQVQPLEANVRLGIGVADLTGTRWTSDYFLAPGFRGDEAMSLPNVGYFVDTVQVTAP